MRMPRVDRVAVETNGATEATPIFAPFFIVTSQGKTSERSTQKLVDVAAMRFDVAGNRRRRMLALLQAEFAQWLDVSIIDVANLRIIKTIQVGELPWGIAISQQ